MKRVLFSVVALSVPFAVQALADEYRLQPGDVVEIGVANYAASGMRLPGSTGLIVKAMLHRQGPDMAESCEAQGETILIFGNSLDVTV